MGEPFTPRPVLPVYYQPASTTQVGDSPAVITASLDRSIRELIAREAEPNSYKGGVIVDYSATSGLTVGIAHRSSNGHWLVSAYAKTSPTLGDLTYGAKFTAYW